MKINYLVAVNLALEYCQNNYTLFSMRPNLQMVFITKKEDMSTQLVEETYYYLDIILDNYLTWPKHLHAPCKTLSNTIHLISRSE